MPKVERHDALTVARGGAWWRVWARFCGNAREPTGTPGNPFPWSERMWSRDLHLAGRVVLYIYYPPG